MDTTKPLDRQGISGQLRDMLKYHEHYKQLRSMVDAFIVLIESGEFDVEQDPKQPIAIKDPACLSCRKIKNVNGVRDIIICGLGKPDRTYRLVDEFDVEPKQPEKPVLYHTIVGGDPGKEPIRLKIVDSNKSDFVKISYTPIYRCKHCCRIFEFIPNGHWCNDRKKGVTVWREVAEKVPNPEYVQNPAKFEHVVVNEPFPTYIKGLKYLEREINSESTIKQLLDRIGDLEIYIKDMRVSQQKTRKQIGGIHRRINDVIDEFDAEEVRSEMELCEHPKKENS